MKSFISNAVKAVSTCLLLVAVSPLLPVVALMHLTAWACDESDPGVATDEQPVKAVKPAKAVEPVNPATFGMTTVLPLAG